MDNTVNSPLNSPEVKSVSAKNRPNPKFWLLISILFVVVIAGLVFSNQENSRQQPAVNTTINEEVDDLEVEVQITKDGFVPSTVSIAKGTKVTWTNVDDNPHRIASNPYPDHTELPSLDSKEALGPDTTYTYTFEEAGTFGYHDHYRPTMNGTIVVE